MTISTQQDDTFGQDIDAQLREMFAIHKEYFDSQERKARGRATINPLRRRTRSYKGTEFDGVGQTLPANREELIAHIVQGDTL
jgi:hypothetical protein|tara:strand:- start:157 stop:405 length:249 start_codon:yes stop_codon:yes gene_type:complete